MIDCSNRKRLLVIVSSVGFHNVRVLYAKRTSLLGCFSISENQIFEEDAYLATGASLHRAGGDALVARVALKERGSMAVTSYNPTGHPRTELLRVLVDTVRPCSPLREPLSRLIHSTRCI